MDRRQRAVGDHVLEHVVGVMADDFDVAEIRGVDPVQKASHSRPVHLDGDEIGVRTPLGDLDGRFTHAGADLENERRAASKNLQR
jgi:hypothetical protein